jgi:hypothetical protein
MRVPVLVVGMKLERVLEEAWEGIGALLLVMAQAATCLQLRRRLVHAVGLDGGGGGDTCGPLWRRDT